MSCAAKMSIKVASKPISAYKFTPVQQPVLTDKEDQLFTLLDEFCKHRANAGHAMVECRVAGGWVRDKVGKYSLPDCHLLITASS
jgi:hypothetical protein